MNALKQLAYSFWKVWLLASLGSHTKDLECSNFCVATSRDATPLDSAANWAARMVFMVSWCKESCRDDGPIGWCRASDALSCEMCTRIFSLWFFSAVSAKAVYVCGQEPQLSPVEKSDSGNRLPLDGESVTPLTRSGIV